MDAGTFDGLLRRAARVIDRRRSLKMLGGGVLGIAALPAGLANASDPSKKNKKLCRRQRGPCLDFVQRRCAADMRFRAAAAAGPAEVDPECVADLNPCCEYFARCQAGAALACLTPPRVPASE